MEDTRIPIGEMEERSNEVVGKNMDERLKEVAKVGYIDELYGILKQDPKVLENFDGIPFSETPLHIAASNGCTDFALEILGLKPSFGRKLNPEGCSPLELALLNGHIDTVRKLIKYDSRLVRVQGREGITPLHRAAENNMDSLVAEFLITCPASIQDTTIHGETALHIAITNRSLKAFQVLFGWILRTENKEVLNLTDNGGNTALHLAARTRQEEILDSLVREVYINEKNDKGSTALDIAMSVPEQGKDTIIWTLKHAGAKNSSSIKDNDTWVNFLSSKSKIIDTILVKFDIYCEKGLSGDMRNALLVVAVLIATATYQALLQPPGGLSQAPDPDSKIILKGYNNFNLTGDTTITGRIVPGDGNATDRDAGKVAMEEGYFYPFIVLNSIAFAASVGMIFALLPVTIYNTLLYISLGFLFLSFVCSGLVISPSQELPYYALQAAFGLYVLIMGARLPFRMRSYPWVQRLSLTMWPRAFHRRQMEWQVFLTKYSIEDDKPPGGCRLTGMQ